MIRLSQWRRSRRPILSRATNLTRRRRAALLLSVPASFESARRLLDSAPSSDLLHSLSWQEGALGTKPDLLEGARFDDGAEEEEQRRRAEEEALQARVEDGSDLTLASDTALGGNSTRAPRSRATRGEEEEDDDAYDGGDEDEKWPVEKILAVRKASA